MYQPYPDSTQLPETTRPPVPAFFGAKALLSGPA
jgi:hypothetical protein